ncbi:MAG: acylneuraminate cytidylyltransferase family protein [Chitinophagaceae bacterium]|nr:acylneuraminate cytidylyltransferase family protein [Chitinophagaceae bacterium]
MKNLCLIPARSGSKELPGKNTKSLNGKKLLEYTFESAAGSRLLDKTILSTDCPVIAEAAFSYRVQVPFLRPAHLASDKTPTADVLRHAINFFDECGERFDHVVLLQPTCPFRKPGFIDQCIEHFVSSGADSLFSVMKVPDQFNPHWVFEPGEHGFLNIATGEESLITSRQLLPPAFARDGSVYIFKADILRGAGSIYGEKIAHIHSENQWHVNIDTHEDWTKAEMIANVLCSVN